jgi:hypothetical protein
MKWLVDVQKASLAKAFRDRYTTAGGLQTPDIRLPGLQWSHEPMVDHEAGLPSQPHMFAELQSFTLTWNTLLKRSTIVGGGDASPRHYMAAVFDLDSGDYFFLR